MHAKKLNKLNKIDKYWIKNAMLTKSVSKDNMLDYKNILEFDKSQVKVVSIMMPLSREGLTSYLSPILGQYGIKNIDFLNTFVSEFHKSTNNIFLSDFNEDDIESNGFLDYDLAIPISLTIYKNGKYSLIPQIPFVGIIYKSAFKKRRVRRAGYKLVRNWKKIYQLSLYNLKKTNNFDDFSILNRQEYYKFTRNTLYKKR